MRLQLISCEVLYREMCHVVAQSPHQVDVRFLPKGLHDLGGGAMCRELQRCIDEASQTEFDAILLGYALCGNGLHGLTSRRVPLVVPRAHDCIALLMGSRATFQEYFEEHPGTYYRSTGWLERGQGLEPAVRMRTGISVSLQEWIAKYGEDAGRYLFKEMNRYREAYSRLAFIRTGIERGDNFEMQARQEAEQRGWQFEEIQGSLRIFEALVSGSWDGDDFLIVPPGHRVAARYDEQIMTAEPL